MLVFLTVGVVQAQNPVPFISQPLVPDVIRPGSIGFTLTVNGSGFVAGSKVRWNGSARTTRFVSQSQLKASIHATDIVKQAAASVVVVNPAPGGGASNMVYFDVTIPTASIGMRASFFNIAGSTPSALAAADFNSDGKPDLLVANLYSNDISVYLSKGNGTFEPAVNYGVGLDTHSLAIGDFNRDGKLDLAVINDGSNTVSAVG